MEGHNCSCDSKLKLGSRVKDTISGFEGVLVGRTRWAWGRTTLGIAPDKLDKDGKPCESQWFDEDRVVAVGKDKPGDISQVFKASDKSTGGPDLDHGKVVR